MASRRTCQDILDLALEIKISDHLNTKQQNQPLHHNAQYRPVIVAVVVVVVVVVVIIIIIIIIIGITLHQSCTTNNFFSKMYKNCRLQKQVLPRIFQ
jgi:hypothetical protein